MDRARPRTARSALSSAGSRLGQRLLAWVEARAAERRAAFVRLDCATDNPSLRRFYEQQGFRHVRDVTVTAFGGGRQLASSLYERELGLGPWGA
ncbi:GNAT family N-acetyltransferase [Curtobacterium sp. VKM Ac-2865]|uniref:GNAT family N-acetyltransferase n=1 Tax=Curtobacterium sp. VKM Ac-2865 TaxID=2783817 RepID=UPI002B2763A0|nr:GNAT family N-acetyltransferase [Curtobacterium sp. VKM Ac-2865]